MRKRYRLVSYWRYLLIRNLRRARRAFTFAEKRASRKSREVRAWEKKHAFYMTPEGQKYLRKYHARWKDRSWKAISLYMVYVEDVPCVHCGETRKRRLQCDHIIPRGLWYYLCWGAMDGVHDRGNLQILCFKCHKQKTNIDSAVIWITREAIRNSAQSRSIV